jgi:hypothetical protein
MKSAALKRKGSPETTRRAKLVLSSGFHARYRGFEGVSRNAWDKSPAFLKSVALKPASTLD